MIKPARLDERAGEERGVGQHVTLADDIPQGGENDVSFRRVHLEQPPRARFRFRSTKNCGDFDMGGKAELVKRRHELDLKAAVDENARVTGEGRRVA